MTAMTDTLSRRVLRVFTPLAFALVIAASLLASIPSAAALEPVATDPLPGGAVGEHPEAIRITFDEPLLLKRGANTAVVLDGDGRELHAARVELAGYSASTLLIHPGPGLPEEGAVSVRWTVRDEGGEQSTGSFVFVIDPGAEEAEPETGDATTEPRSSEAIVLWTIVIALATAAVGIGLYYLRVELGLGKSSLEEDSH